MARYLVSPRACVSAALLVIVGSVVLFTAAWRSVLDSFSWRTPLAGYLVFGLAVSGLIVYVVYWCLLVYLVVRAYLLRKSRQFLKAVHYVTLALGLGRDALLETVKIGRGESTGPSGSGDAQQYSSRFPQGYQLEQGFLESYELTTVELGADYGGFRLKARSRETGRCVSAKFFPPSTARALWIDHPEHGSLPYELSIFAQLNHHNIVSTLYAIKDNFGWGYLVQEMGTSLSDFVATAEYKRRRISMARHIFTQIVEAVTYIHQIGVAHNDLRLDNFIVTEFAEVKLTGFHGSRPSLGEDCSHLLYASRDYYGDELHAPPEVLSDSSEHYSASHADIWSLGVVLFELLLGYVPFTTKDQILQVADGGGFPTHAWPAGDPELLDSVGVSPLLGTCCFVVNPIDRSTIEALKAHPWLQRSDAPPIISSVVPNRILRGISSSPDSDSATPIVRIGHLSLGSQSSAVLGALQQFRDHFFTSIKFNSDFLSTYRPGHMIGAGSYGCVIKARHRTQGHNVAFKFIAKSGVSSTGWTVDENGNRLPLEVKLMKMAMHENIARSLDVFQDNDFFYIGVELHGSDWSGPGDHSDQGGCTLLDYIDARGPSSEDYARYIFGQLVEAVHYLSSIGISHGDIKPGNVLIDNNLKVKLIDFGNAVLDDLSLPIHQQVRDTDFYCGTEVFMPPECFECNVVYHPLADVWSLGVLLTQLLTCSIPFLNKEDVLSMTWRFEREEAVERWHGLGGLAKHLIGEACVVKEIGKRARIGEVREHPWLVGWRDVGEMIKIVKELKMVEDDI